MAGEGDPMDSKTLSAVKGRGRTTLEATNSRGHRRNLALPRLRAPATAGDRRWRAAAIFTLALVGLLLTDGTAEANIIVSPDTAGNVGQYTSLALDAGGRPVVSYFDVSNGDLKVLHCGNADCSTGNSITSPDTVGNVGQYTSLALDSSGYPVISYRDATNDKLKVLHCNDSNCAGGDESVTSLDTGGYTTSLLLDSSGNPVVSYIDDNYELRLLHCGNANCTAGNSTTSPDTGLREWYTSLTLDPSGNPVIAYQDYLYFDLKVLHCDDPYCADDESSNITSPDATGSVGDWPSLALDSGGNPVVSYYDTTGGKLKVLHCGNASCTEDNSISSPDTPISGGIAGNLSTSLALDSLGRPVVSYHHEINQDLKILHCGNSNCTAGNTTASSDTADSVGSDSSMVLDATGRPVVSYFYDTGADLRMLHCSNTNCATSTPAANTIVSPDTIGEVGHDTSLVLDAGGRPVVSYYNNTNGDLKVLHCGDPNCTAGNSITSPDTVGYVGETSSLALDGGGRPVVSYRDATNYDLKLLHCGNADCTAGNSITSPDTTNGAYTSLALDSSGNPVVSYQGGAYDLRVLHCNDANCTGGDESITSPDTGGMVGYDTSLALDASGYPVVSYLDFTNANLKMLHCNDVNCAGGDDSITSPDTVGDVGGSTSLALDGSGNPVVSYWDYTNSRLKVMHCNDSNCAGGDESITSPDSGGWADVSTSLALDASGFPVVSFFYGTTFDLKVMHCSDANCAGGDESITSPDTERSVGYYTSLALDAAGNPVVSYYDGTNDDLKILHCVTPTCAVPFISTVAGQHDTSGFADGAPANARFDSPQGIYETADGSLYIADKNNDAIRKTDPATGNVSTVAGRGAGCVTNPTPPHDGCLATEATLSDPRDVFVSSNPGDIYIADTGNHRVRKVDGGTGIITTIAGTGTQGYSGDAGAATAAKLDSPSGVAIDESGNVYIADTGNNCIRKADAATGIITTIAGNGTAGYAGDHGAATSAALNGPRDVFPWGSMYAGTTDLIIADTGNNRIRWVHGPSGIIDTFAGTGTAGFSGDGEAAIQAKLSAPEAVASDASLAVYVADTQNDRIRRIGFGGAVIATIAGGGSGCPANSTPPYDGCPATDAVLDKPAGFAVGSCIGSDTDNETIRKIDCATGLPVGGFTGATGCTYGTVATIDFLLVLLPLAVILRRSRIGTWFLGTRKVGRP